MIDWSKMDMRVSRTEQKKAHERLQQLAQPLAHLSKKQLKKLTVSEFLLAELNALANLPDGSARNRQIKRIGKMMAEENRDELIDGLFTLSFSPEQANKIDAWYDRLNINDESTLKQFGKQFYVVERNSLYQLLLWIEYAKYLQDDELLAESEADLKNYIHEVAILSK